MTIGLIATDPESSIYVDASAGSGKTKILIDRMMRLLLSGVQPSKILCITFTNAATNEMKERLYGELFKWITTTEAKLQKKIYDLTGHFPSQIAIERARGLFQECMEKQPRITTMHGFCSTILQKLSVIQSIDDLQDNMPHVIDEDEKNELMKEAFSKVVTELLIKREPSFKTLIAEYDTGYLFDLITAFWNDISTDSNVISNAVSLAKNNKSPIPVKEIVEFAESKIISLLEINENEDDPIEKYIELCDYDTLHEIASVLLESTNITSIEAGDKLRNWLRNEKKAENFNEYTSVFLTSEYKPRARLPLNAAACKKYPHLASYMFEEQRKITEIWQKVFRKKNAEINIAFNKFAWKVFNKFNEIKKQLFEYGDLIRSAFNIMEGDEKGAGILYSLDMMIDHIMVDEAQDLSPAQWSIIKKLSEEFHSSAEGKRRTIFIVGDFKQAIFSFQGAAPKIFQDIKYFFREKFHQANKKWNEVKLEKCYRCMPEILSIVDHVCNTDNMKGAFGLLDGEINHFSAHGNGNGAVHIHKIEDNTLFTKPTTDRWIINQEKIVNEDNKNTLLAQKISIMISEWLENKKCNGKAVEPKDILILIRKRSSLQDELVRELQNLSIKVSNLAAKTSPISVDFYDVISAAQFAVQNLDDMNLVALLKSPAFSVDDDILMKVAINRKIHLWDVVKEMNLPFYKKLQSIINKSQESLYGFFSWCCSELFPNSGIKNDFMNYVIEYQSTIKYTKQSLQHFIVWLLEHFKNEKKKAYNDNAVKITTVHSAKGLEAPIVILADAGSSEDLQPVRFITDEGVFLLSRKFADIEKKLFDDNIEKSKLENFRLLYVAITRAKYELHVCGAKNNIDDEKLNWYTTILKSKKHHDEKHNS